MNLPVIHLDRVFHIGTLDPADLGRHFGGGGYEGNSLSVSLCPIGWRQIARLGGNDLHLMRRLSGSFLDLHAAIKDAELLDAIRSWGIEKNLVKSGSLWRAWSYDEDDEDWRFMTCATREEAFAEVDGMEDDSAEDIEGPDGKPGIEEVSALIGAEALAAITGIACGGDEDATEALVVAWAMSEAAAVLGAPLDGVWWREDYDPDSYSAPRGAIFSDRVSEWKAERTGWGVVDEEELDAMPETVVHGLETAPRM